MGRRHGERARPGVPPPPGSESALKAGCSCPVEPNIALPDNTHGVVRHDCPLHGWGTGEAIPQVRKYDAARYLRTAEQMAAYLEEASKDGDPRLLAMALSAIARARGMTAQPPAEGELEAVPPACSKLFGGGHAVDEFLAERRTLQDVVGVIHLSPEDQARFVEAILDPPALNEALQKAFERRAKLFTEPEAEQV